MAVFEPDLSGTPISDLFHGHMSTLVLTDPHGRTPDTIISMTDDWHLKVEWQFHGTMVRGGLVGGKWRVQAFMESIGPGDEMIVATKEVDIATGGVPDAFGRAYSETFLIGPNIPSSPGPYKLVTVITCVGATGVPGPFAGYDEYPMLQFYAGANLPQ
jgi:hypothetical protein